MFCKKFSVLLCVIALALVAGIANADFLGSTYVDATTSNTTPGTAFSVSESDTDDLWHVDTSRTFARNGDVMVTQSSTETAPLLTTTVSGLANGVYDVYAVYWTESPNLWGLDGAIAGGSIVACTQFGGTPTGNSLDNKVEYSMLLGQANVIGGSLAVTIAERDGYSRSWYEGVAYQALAVPEPSTIALLVTGLFGLLAYAWRKRR